MFDWGLSTEENYRSHDRQMFGRFRTIREQLDYEYHSNYLPSRQILQDTIVNTFLQQSVGDSSSCEEEPWIIFTAGAMGAGKSHTVRELRRQGELPVDSFVNVDPDEIRRVLPEFEGYIRFSPEHAGELTRKEAGLVAEVLTKAALGEGRCVLVDGTLRDAAWYLDYFTMLRGSYPNIKIGIIHVTAPEQTILERARHRAEVTGRVVPKTVILESIYQVPRSINLLRNRVDYYLEVSNTQQ